MSIKKEKGRPAEGSPIPKFIPRQEQSESSASLLRIQVSRLTRRCAISVAMAEAIAPMIYGVQS